MTSAKHPEIEALREAWRDDRYRDARTLLAAAERRMDELVRERDEARDALKSIRDFPRSQLDANPHALHHIAAAYFRDLAAFEARAKERG